MENGADKWNQVMVAAMAVPGIKVNRASFLQEELSNRHIGQNTISLCIQENPVKHLDIAKLDAIAKACIKNHTLKVTAISAAAGIPGGFAMIGTLPADAAQYYYHVLKVAQKLAYIYGYPSLLDENGNLKAFLEDLSILVNVYTVDMSRIGVVVSRKYANLSKDDVFYRERMFILRWTNGSLPFAPSFKELAEIYDYPLVQYVINLPKERQIDGCHFEGLSFPVQLTFIVDHLLTY